MPAKLLFLFLMLSHLASADTHERHAPHTPSHIPQAPAKSITNLVDQFCQGYGYEAICNYPLKQPAPFEKPNLYSKLGTAPEPLADVLIRSAKNFDTIAQKVPFAEIRDRVLAAYANMGPADQLAVNALKRVKLVSPESYAKWAQSHDFSYFYIKTCGWKGEIPNAAALPSNIFTEDNHEPWFTICPKLLYLAGQSKQDFASPLVPLSNAAELRLTFTIAHELAHLGQPPRIDPQYLGETDIKKDAFVYLNKCYKDPATRPLGFKWDYAPQAYEIQADSIAAEVLADKLKPLHSPQKLLEGLANAYQVLCQNVARDWPTQQPDHPSDRFRLDYIVSTNTRLREMMGCRGPNKNIRRDGNVCTLRGVEKFEVR